MTSSLVGSEMCIRDRLRASIKRLGVTGVRLHASIKIWGVNGVCLLASMTGCDSVQASRDWACLGCDSMGLHASIKRLG
eukprot:7909050-Prorocentrum_lima.AAC.1